MEIVVIGGGVIGLSAAVECQRRGHRVILVEKSPEKRGSSLGNAGMIVPSHFVPLAAPGMVALGFKWMWNPESPFYIRPSLDPSLVGWGMRFIRSATKQHVDRSAPLLRDLHMASRQLYVELSQEFDIGLEQRGLVMLCKTQAALDEEAHMAERSKGLGIPADVLDAEGLAKLDPSITMDAVGGVFFPKDCHLQPDRFVAALLKKFQEGGGQIVDEVTVTGWQHDGSRLTALRTSQGNIAGEQFVLSSGIYSTELAKALSIHLPMQAGKGYSVTLPNPIERSSICSILTEARVAVTPMGASMRFGGTMEIAGLNESISVRRVAGILKSIPKYYPKFQAKDFEGLEPWCGLRPCSPDGMPYIGRAKKFDNLVISTGHAMMGLSLAPISGRLVGEIIDRQPPCIPIEALAPERFS